jgi:tyrosine-protein kinase
VPARHSLLLIWRHRRFLGFCVIACVSIAAVLAVTAERSYESTTQFFASISDSGRDVGAAYRGELFSQQRLATYAEIVSSTELLEAVARDLRLPGGTRELEGKIQASIRPDTALIDVTAASDSPGRAKAIADALGRQLPGFIAALEAPSGASMAPVRVSVTREAELPRAAASPDLKLNLALGLVAGLVLAAAGVALSAAFDDRVRSVAAIERIVGAPVLGSVAENGDELGSLVLLDDPLSARAEDYRRIRTQLRARWGGSTVSSLVVSSVGGDNGKTLMAANLGLALARGGQHVALVDGSPRGPSLSALFGLASAAGLTDLLRGAVAPEAALTRLRDLPLAVVGAGTPQRDSTDVLTSPRLLAVINTLRKHADVVIIDAPPLERGADASTLVADASALLLVARVGVTAAAQLESAARAVGPRSSPLFGVVVNRRELRRSGSWDAFRLFAGGVAPPPPRDAEADADAATQPHVASGHRA